MRSMLIMALVALAGASAFGADPKAQPGARTSTLVRPMPELQLRTTNAVYRSQKHPNLEYSGSLVQAVKFDKGWQVINPLAPARYGSAEANTMRHPETKRTEGVKLFVLGF